MNLAVNYTTAENSNPKFSLEISVKPFLKWAGGKTQLLGTIDSNLPLELKNRKIKKYVEPFVGSGAVLFYLISKYNFEEIYINDTNKELINTYITIKKDVQKLILELKELQNMYLTLNNEKRSELFYQIRTLYNGDNSDIIKHSAYFIFLNRTCFNGLYRVNSKGKFNVPFGKYVNPKICDEENLLKAAEILKNVKILNNDFEKTDEYIDENTFVYFDPPYRPLSNTSSFNSYSKEIFNDEAQKRLADFYKRLHKKKAKLILSNSDPKNTCQDDDFFDDLYSDFNILRVNAKRMINSNASKRGNVTELLILNYRGGSR